MQGDNSNAANGISNIFNFRARYHAVCMPRAVIVTRCYSGASRHGVWTWFGFPVHGQLDTESCARCLQLLWTNRGESGPRCVIGARLVHSFTRA
jgi:hypothetical protein